VKNATVYLRPGESAQITLRVVGSSKDAVVQFLSSGIAPAAVAQAINTPDLTLPVPVPQYSVAGLAVATPAALPAPVAGSQYNVTLVAPGGTLPYTWGLASGSAPLPAGLVLDPVTGALTGTPTIPGTYSFTVRVMDSAGNVSTQTMTMVVSALVVSTPRLSFAAPPGNTVLNQTIAPTVQVQVADGVGNPVQGTMVTLAMGNNPGSGTLTGIATLATDSGGLATFSNLSINAPGVGYTFVASVSGVQPATSNPFNIESQLVPLVTNLTPMALSSNSDEPNASMINQAGDYAFHGPPYLSPAESALFLRRAGAPAPMYVIQAGDEMPGFPGSRVDIINTMSLNNTGLLAFSVTGGMPDGGSQAIIATFDGTSIHKIVYGGDAAPDTGGATYGRGLSLLGDGLGLNDSGDVAFAAPLVPARSSLFIAPGGGAPVRIASVGDAAPGMSLGETFSSLSALGFNNRGEVLFRANISGGAGGAGFFVGTTAHVLKVAANGDSVPGGGTFSISSTNSALLNNAGEVAFIDNSALWVYSPTAGISQAAATGSAAPGVLGGTISSTPSLGAFNDAGEIAFTANITGSAITDLAICRFRLGYPLELVSYRNQSAPGAPGETFGGYYSTSLSINSAGNVSFFGWLTGGPIAAGFFQQLGSGLPSAVALDGQATSLPGGGIYSMGGWMGAWTTNEILDTGAVFFWANVSGGAAYYGEFLVLGSSTINLMSTADALPPGAKVSLRPGVAPIAGDYTTFTARPNGGRISYGVLNSTTHSTTILATAGDPAPNPIGGQINFDYGGTPYANASAARAPEII
jgi:hypothetical protein